VDGLVELKQSFAERKTAQLSQERDARGEVEPVTPTDLDNEAPLADGQESEDIDQDESQTVGAVDEQDDEGEPSSTDLDTETPGEQDPEDGEQQHDWETRYKDLQSETQADRENRGEMEQEHARSMQDHMSLRFDLEDKLTEAGNRLEFSKQIMDGNAGRFQNINWSQVPPEKIQEVQAQAQQAFTMKQQADAAYAQFDEHRQSTLETVKQREAEIAKVRLRRTIPGWSNEIYASIREFATAQGMAENGFSRITDPVIIEALYSASKIAETGSNIQSKTKRKPQVPRNRGKQQRPRDARGKYAKTPLVPNQRGSFADKHRHRLAMERG